VKNLLAILRDEKAESFKPQSLRYSVEGPKDELRHLLLQKRNGDFYLVLWRAVAVWDEIARKEVSVETIPVTVQLDKPAKWVRVYRPTKSAEPFETRRDVTMLPVNLGAEAVLLEIRYSRQNAQGGLESSASPAPEIAALYFPGFHRDDHYDKWLGEG
jgi:hypothetical protein